MLTVAAKAALRAAGGLKTLRSTIVEADMFELPVLERAVLALPPGGGLGQ